MRSYCQELDHNLADDDLEAAAEELFTHRCRGAELPEEGSLLAVPKARDDTEGEIQAVKWKLNNYA